MSIFGFLRFSFTDLLDILMVGILIFLVFKWIRGSAAMNIFIAVVIIFFLRLLVSAFNMKMMNALLGAFMDMGVLAIIIIFQPEVRHFLMRFGSKSGVTSRTRKFIDRLMGIHENKMGGDVVNEIAEACRTMSSQKTGALIVLPGTNSVSSIVETGDTIDAKVTRRLIMNIFFKNSPLHDGAMVIEGERIVAARCTLPITGRNDIPPQYGMRHKAAIGVSEECDAGVIVVSEETGGISYVKSGKLTSIGNINELKLLLGAGESSREQQPKPEQEEAK